MRKSVYFNCKPVMDRHTNTTSDKDPTSACHACTIMNLTLRRLATSHTLLSTLEEDLGIYKTSIKHNNNNYIHFVVFGVLVGQVFSQ